MLPTHTPAVMTSAQHSLTRLQAELGYLRALGVSQALIDRAIDEERRAHEAAAAILGELGPTK